ncbi:MAG: DUF4136 domain-containing protein [Bacteroidia bacterium]|nr:DUF4136 domain-containing protein [Bacteroidia bacterium]
MKFILSIFLFAAVFDLSAQSIEVEYDKKKDMSAYKTFQFGEAEVITPKDKRVFDEAKTRAIANGAIERELKERGLQRVDSNAHLIVSYIIGSMERSSVYNAGPLGGTPGVVSSGATMRDYNEGSFIIDLNDRSGNLIWRVNAVSNFTEANMQVQLEQTVDTGFRKFPNKPKTKKSKK